jgi:hypothetical protein
MKEEKEEKDEQEKPDKKRKVQVTVLYTSTAEDRNFVVEQDKTFQQVVSEAYKHLDETPRAGDQFFCHSAPRHDLRPYLGTTLRAMKEKGICVRDDGRRTLELEFDIDAEPGGAGQK